MTPNGWEKRSIGELCEFLNGHGFKKSEWSSAGLPIIRIQNLNGSTDFNYYAGKVKDQWVVMPGQLLFAWAGTRGVSFGPAVWTGPKGLLNQHIYKLEVSPNVDSTWFYNTLLRITEKVERRAHGFKATLLHVKKSDIIDQVVPVPDRKEQKQIGHILSTWDKAIETTDKLIENGKNQKRALMQQLLKGKKALQEHPGDWNEMRICEIADRVTRKADGQKYPILTISSTSGFVRQDEKYGRYMAGKSVERYILLKKGEFAYNKGNSKTYEFGCVFDLQSYEKALVPHVYVCFRLKPGFNHRFFRFMFESDYLRGQLGRLVNTGVRNNGLLNIKPAEFLNTTVPVPSENEQARIADVLETSTTEILRQTSSRAALEMQKKALMQQLLTGKRRARLVDTSVVTADN